MPPKPTFLPLAVALALSGLGCTHTRAPADRAGKAPPPAAPPPNAAPSSAPLTPGTLSSAPAPQGSASATPTPQGDAASPAEPGARDFENQLEQGGADEGPGDPGLLARKPGFTPYANGRFGFSLDVPNAFTAMPGPANGDGLQWRLGGQAAMTASGIHWSPDTEGPLCASSSNVSSRKETKTTCFATGKRDGFIFWERAVFSRGTLYTLRFQYAESLKTAIDPVVARVNKSWKF